MQLYSSLLSWMLLKVKWILTIIQQFLFVNKNKDEDFTI